MTVHDYDVRWSILGCFIFTALHICGWTDIIQDQGGERTPAVAHLDRHPPYTEDCQNWLQIHNFQRIFFVIHIVIEKVVRLK